MNKQGLTIIVFIIAAVLLGWQFFRPAFNEVTILRENLKTWQTKLSETQNLKEKFESLKIKYAGMSDEADRIFKAVPQKEDLPSLLVLLEDLSSGSGLLLDGIDFKAVKNDDKKTLAASGLKELTVEMSLTGSQEALRSFLKAVEGNLRLMDVSSINFGNQDVGSSQRDLDVFLKAYFIE